MQEISRIDIWSSRGLQVVGISKEGTSDLERFLRRVRRHHHIPRGLRFGRRHLHQLARQLSAEGSLAHRLLVDAKGIIQWIGSFQEKNLTVFSKTLSRAGTYERLIHGEKAQEVRPKRPASTTTGKMPSRIACKCSEMGKASEPPVGNLPSVRDRPG